MANQLGGQTGASPRCYRKHQRYALFGRETVHAGQLTSFLTWQAGATRLSTTIAIVFAKLTKYGSARVKNAVNLAALP